MAQAKPVAGKQSTEEKGVRVTIKSNKAIAGKRSFLNICVVTATRNNIVGRLLCAHPFRVVCAPTFHFHEI